MSFDYYIPSPEERPEWICNLILDSRKLAPKYKDESWIWTWNRIHEHKIRVRNGNLIVSFNTESDMTMFALKHS